MKKVFNLIIVDESGSMSVIRKQAFSGMNETLSTVRAMQEKFPDTEQHVTLVTFDSDHMKWHFNDALAKDTHDLKWKDYNPCAATPLYDAIGKTVSKLNAQVGNDDNVLVTIITDGDFARFNSQFSCPAVFKKPVIHLQLRDTLERLVKSLLEISILSVLG